MTGKGEGEFFRRLADFAKDPFEAMSMHEVETIVRCMLEAKADFPTMEQENQVAYQKDAAASSRKAFSKLSFLRLIRNSLFHNGKARLHPSWKT